MPKAASSIPDVDQIIEDACARNVQIELHRVVGGEKVPTARARLLQADKDFIYLDNPQVIGQNIQIRSSDEIHAYFVLEGELLTFLTAIKKVGARIQLNAEKSVPGIILTRPAGIQSGQRRDCFRTSLLGIDQIPVMLHETCPDTPSAAPINARHMQGTLVDASELGMGVTVKSSNHFPIRMYNTYFLHTKIPMGECELTLMAELRQIRPVGDGSMKRLGFVFLPWPNQRALRKQLEPLQRSFLALQRQRRGIA